jgi:hypothetical protein
MKKKKLYFFVKDYSPDSFECIESVEIEDRIYTAAELIALEPIYPWEKVAYLYTGSPVFICPIETYPDELMKYLFGGVSC